MRAYGSRRAPMQRNEYLALRVLWVLGDALAIYAGLLLAYSIRYSLDWLPLVERLSPTTERYAVIMPAAIPLWLGLFALNRLYDARYLLNGLQEYGQVVVGCSLG